MAQDNKSVSLFEKWKASGHKENAGSFFVQKPLLDHVEDGAVFIKPNVVVGYRHRLKSDFLGIFKERIWPPDEVQPFDWQKPVFPRHIFRQD